MTKPVQSQVLNDQIAIQRIMIILKGVKSTIYSKKNTQVSSIRAELLSPTRAQEVSLRFSEEEAFKVSFLSKTRSAYNCIYNKHITREGHENGNGRGLPFPFSLFPGTLGMEMEIFKEDIFPPFPGILGMGMTSSGDSELPTNSKIFFIPTLCVPILITIENTKK